MCPREAELDALILRDQISHEVLQPRLRFSQVRDQGHGPKDGSCVETPAHLLSALLEPMRCLRKKLKRDRIPSKGIVEYLKFRRPWLISLWPESAILVARYVEAKWDTLECARCAVEERSDAGIAKPLGSTLARRAATRLSLASEQAFEKMIADNSEC